MRKLFNFITVLLMAFCVFSFTASANPKDSTEFSKSPVIVQLTATVQAADFRQKPVKGFAFDCRFQTLRESALTTPNYSDNVRLRPIEAPAVSPPTEPPETSKNKPAEFEPDIIRKSWRIPKRN